MVLCWSSMIDGQAQKWVLAHTSGWRIFRTSELWLSILVWCRCHLSFGEQSKLKVQLNKRVAGWLHAEEMSNQAASLCLAEGQEAKTPSCHGDGNFLTEGALEGREFYSIVYLESHRFSLNFCNDCGLSGTDLLELSLSNIFRPHRALLVCQEWHSNFF